MYYPSSKNKGADQLCGYREADLRLCFRICRLLVFPWGGSNICRNFYFFLLFLDDEVDTDSSMEDDDDDEWED